MIPPSRNTGFVGTPSSLTASSTSGLSSTVVTPFEHSLSYDKLFILRALFFFLTSSILFSMSLVVIRSIYQTVVGMYMFEISMILPARRGITLLQKSSSFVAVLPFHSLPLLLKKFNSTEEAIILHYPFLTQGTHH